MQELAWLLGGAALVMMGYLMGRASIGSDYSRLRMDVDEALEKATHLHDRVRKRIRLQPAEEPTGNTPLPGAGELDRKALLRRRAFERGLLYAGVSGRGHQDSYPGRSEGDRGSPGE